MAQLPLVLVYHSPVSKSPPFGEWLRHLVSLRWYFTRNHHHPSPPQTSEVTPSSGCGAWQISSSRWGTNKKTANQSMSQISHELHTHKKSMFDILYFPTFGWSVWSMQANIPYMDPMGYRYVLSTIQNVQEADTVVQSPLRRWRTSKYFSVPEPRVFYRMVS